MLFISTHVNRHITLRQSLLSEDLMFTPVCLELVLWRASFASNPAMLYVSPGAVCYSWFKVQLLPLTSGTSLVRLKVQLLSVCCMEAVRAEKGSKLIIDSCKCTRGRIPFHPFSGSFYLPCPWVDHSLLWLAVLMLSEFALFYDNPCTWAPTEAMFWK